MHTDRSSQQATQTGAHLRLRGLCKAYGALAAVEDLTVDIAGGAFVSLLGPSGSGKTTTLNLIAGFLAPDSGDILIDERSVADVPPHKRNIGMVFQSYALFPHMTVAENVAFPLRMRGKLPRESARKRIGEMLALVQLSQCESRYPRQLSGGQQQRVAMARALVSRPRLLLMDEPLGALDKKLREQMQAEIRRIHRSVGTTVVYVTHDQSEALTMSDLVVVMQHGRIAQMGTPRALYETPANAFVAEFVGDSNLLPVRTIGSARDCVALANGPVVGAPRGQPLLPTQERVFLLLRPEDLSVELLGAPRTQDRERLEGTITEVSFHGDVYKLAIAVGDEVLKARVAREEAGNCAVGRQVFVSWKRDAARLLPDPRENPVEAATS